jgi:hypothetical protein
MNVTESGASTVAGFWIKGSRNIMFLPLQSLRYSLKVAILL